MEHSYTKTQMTWLMLLRLFIGWHFMYEGLVKIMNPKWTSLPYLLDSKGFASDFFVKLTQDESLMSLVNVCNEWALFLIGLGLTLGCLSHPSFIGASYLQPFEGSYLWIDKNLVELAALGLMCVFPTSQIIGFDRVLGRVCPILKKLKFI